ARQPVQEQGSQRHQGGAPDLRHAAYPERQPQVSAGAHTHTRCLGHPDSRTSSPGDNNMKAFGKTLGLLLASLTLASCGGGGGDGGAFTEPQSGTFTLTATSTTLPVNVWGYQPIQYGNPTQAEVTIVWRAANGT